MIGFFDYTVIATYVSLASGVFGIVFALNDSPMVAIFCLMLSGLLPLGSAIYKMLDGVSLGWVILTIVLACYGAAYVYAFIKMLRHYHLPFDRAFDLCVKDLLWLAAKWHTTYHIVNLLIFIMFYLILLGLNVFVCYFLIYL